MTRTQGTRRTRRTACALGFLTLLLVFFVESAIPQEMSVEVPLQFRLFLKILHFDRNLAARVGNELIIGIVFQSGFRSSDLAMQEFCAAMDEARGSGLDGIPIRRVLIDLDRQTDVEEAISTNGVNVLYVAPVRAFELEKLTAVSRARKITTLTGVADYVAKGISVGVSLKDDRPEILVNLAASRAEGADLSSSLLKLARVIG